MHRPYPQILTCPPNLARLANPPVTLKTHAKALSKRPTSPSTGAMTLGIEVEVQQTTKGVKVDSSRTEGRTALGNVELLRRLQNLPLRPKARKKTATR